MKTIGIKLADGTFYSVLQEDQPGEKTLELTTAHNDQTRVMVDLYRTKTGTMEEAEYVDTLRIDNLVKHPSGEPDISFVISIDENNELSARIVDKETGASSDTTIELVNRTLEERLEADPTESEYEINDAAEEATEQVIENEPDVVIEPTIDESEVAVEEPVVEEETIAMESAVDEPMITEDAPIEETFSNEMLTEGLPEMDDTFAMNESFAEDETPNEDIAFDEQPPEIDDTILSDTPIETDENPFETPSEDSIVTDDLPDFGSSEDISEETPSEDSIITDDLPDFGDTLDMPENTSTNNDIFEDTLPSSDDTFNSADLDLPSFGDDTFSDTSSSLDDSFNSGDLDLPDFDNNTFGDTSLPDDDPFANPSSDDIFGDSSSDDIFGDTSSDDDIFGESSSTPAATQMGGGMFDGLYDEPAAEKKKIKTPVIICIICAIICIVAVLLIFFVIPSKINLLGKTGNTEIVQSEKIETPPVSTIIVEAEPEPEPEPFVPSAKEDEIVIIEEAEIVKPEPPAPPKPEPKPDIIYKVKWGDTLWDIADTYYKNPWRYIKIANYNGIRNPDYIISGTTILIPQE